MSLTKQQKVRRNEMRLLLYAMRGKWGLDADLYKITNLQPNYDTGEKGVIRTKYRLRWFMSSALEFTHKFEYDIGFLAANKNFTYGGFYEPGDRLAVVDSSELPVNFELEMKDYFIFDGKRLDIVKVTEIDFKVGWILHLRHTKDNARYAIHETFVYSHLNVSQEIDNEGV